MPNVIVLLCSDLHLCHTPPVARSAESDWYSAMTRPLNELKELQKEYDCPVLVAGDIFNRWKVCPELVNFAIEHLPEVWAIPGQHDIPYHNLDELKKSAFWTLVEAGTLRVFPDWEPVEWDDRKLTVWSYSWGKDISNIRNLFCSLEEREGELFVLLTHSYIWKGKHKYPGAPETSNLKSYQQKLKGYDVAVFGDNHDGFTAKSGNCTVYNCGCLIRRKIDEKHYKPAVGLLYEDGTVERHYLDTSQDEWIDSDDSVLEETGPEGLLEFIEELRSLDEVPDLDFREEILRYLSDNKVTEEIKQELLKAMGE